MPKVGADAIALVVNVEVRHTMDGYVSGSSHRLLLPAHLPRATDLVRPGSRSHSIVLRTALQQCPAEHAHTRTCHTRQDNLLQSGREHPAIPAQQSIHVLPIQWSELRVRTILVSPATPTTRTVLPGQGYQYLGGLRLHNNRNGQYDVQSFSRHCANSVSLRMSSTMPLTSSE